MKTKDYIRKYHLYKVGAKINSRDLADDLFNELNESITAQRAQNKGPLTYNQFQGLVTQALSKVDSINLKALTEISEGFIKYFYASRVVNLKKELFPEIYAQDEKRHQDNLEKKRQRDERRKKADMELYFDDHGW